MDSFLQRVSAIVHFDDEFFSSIEDEQTATVDSPKQIRSNQRLSVAGTASSQFVAGLSSSSGRPSLQSNNSVSPTADRKMSLQTRGRRPSMFDPIDPKELQQALYASAVAKGKIQLNKSNDNDQEESSSTISFRYDRNNDRLFIENLRLENLSLIDVSKKNGNENDSINFYCRFRLLPHRRTLFQTKIFRWNLCQTSFVIDKTNFDVFDIFYDQLINHSIELLLYKVGGAKSAFKDIRLGAVKFDLGQLVELDQIEMKKNIEQIDSNSINDPDLGELMISLSYLQSAGKLSVVILQANHLRPLSNESKSLPESSVKVTLFDRHRKKLKRKKTAVQRASTCPTFNEEFIFELRRELANEVMIEVRIVHESLSYKEQIGSVIFGPLTNQINKGPSTTENIYWSTVLSGETLSGQWLNLKPTTKIEEFK